MYIGKLVSVNADNITGQVSPDDSDELYNFRDPNLPSTGLVQGDDCMFDVTCTATFGGIVCNASNIQPVTINRTVINSPQTGNLSIGQNDEVVVRTGGEVNGMITITGGILKLNGGNVNGNVDATQGGFINVKQDSTVTGNISVDGARFKIDGGTVTGTADLNNSGEGTLRTGGEVNGMITITGGSITKVKAGGIVNDVTIGSGNEFIVRTGGEVNGCITITSTTPVKIG